MGADECHSRGLSVGNTFVGESATLSVRSVPAVGVKEFPFPDESDQSDAKVDQLEKSSLYPPVPYVPSKRRGFQEPVDGSSSPKESAESACPSTKSIEEKYPS